MSLNLHAIVRQAINANYADETFKLYRSVGQKNVGGIVQAYYAPAEEIQGNFQSEGDSALLSRTEHHHPAPVSLRIERPEAATLGNL